MKDVLSWMRTTDLTEVSYRREQLGLGFRLEGSTAASDSGLAPCALIPVTSPEVGLFRFNEAGSPRRAEPGALVAEGDILGLVEVGAREHLIKSPAAGRLISIQIDDGKPVEYGQSLFFIRPE